MRSLCLRRLGLLGMIMIPSAFLTGVILWIVNFFNSLFVESPLSFGAFVADNITLTLVLSGGVTLATGFIVLLIMGYIATKHLKMLGWIGLYGVVFLLANVLVGVFMGIIYEINSMLADAPLPLDIFLAENMTVMLVITGILTVVLGFIVLLLRGHNPIKYVQLGFMSAKNTALMAAMGVGFAFFVNSLMNLIRIDQYLPDTISEQLVEMMTANVFLAFLAIGIVVPIYEEILVRGLVFNELRRNMNIWVALMLQGLIFGLMHGNMLQFSYTFPVGIILGIVYVKYRSIWAPIIIHLVWNSTSMLMGYIMPEIRSNSTYILFLIFGATLFLGGTIYSFLCGPPLLGGDWSTKESALEESHPQLIE